ncbi:MAG: cysteine desulfurase family protein [bacterium]
MLKSKGKLNLPSKTKASAGKVYMDYAASFLPNPSSIHSLGIEAKSRLENARKEVANILSTIPENVIFTSGGTESNNLAIQGVVFAWVLDKREKKIPHIITTNIEHPSVLETFKLLEKRNLVQISIVSVEPNGIVDPKKIKKEIKDNTVLVSVIYANNEIGTIQPIKEIAKEIRHFKKNNRQGLFPLFHTDGVQAANYLDLNVEKLGVDLLALSSSKIEGGGRVGVLYKRKNVPLANIFGGGDQEMGLRPGTENLEEILKFSSALKLAYKMKENENKRLLILKDYFIKKLLNLDPDIKINGDLINRLPNNINITIPNIPSDLLVIELSAYGIMVSSKSACKSSSKEGSYVIKAIHPEIDSEIGGLRFSLGRSTTKKDIDFTLKTLSKILKKLGKWYN